MSDALRGKSLLLYIDRVGNSYRVSESCLGLLGSDVEEGLRFVLQAHQCDPDAAACRVDFVLVLFATKVRRLASVRVSTPLVPKTIRPRFSTLLVYPLCGVQHTPLRGY